MVVVVESDALLRRALIRMLEHAGFEAAGVRNAPGVLDHPSLRAIVVEEDLAPLLPERLWFAPKVILRIKGAMLRHERTVWLPKLAVGEGLEAALHTLEVRPVAGPSRYAQTVRENWC